MELVQMVSDWLFEANSKDSHATEKAQMTDNADVLVCDVPSSHESWQYQVVATVFGPAC